MRMETEYLVSAKSAEALDRIFNQWEDTYDKEDDCSFESYDTDVFGVMEKVIKVVHQMEQSGQKDEFTVVGKCESDYDCAVFPIEYARPEPLIKAYQAHPEEHEGQYYQFCEADYEEIPKLLKRNKNRTFKQAIKDELPLGGFLDVSYEEWYNSILGK